MDPSTLITAGAVVYLALANRSAIKSSLSGVIAKYRPAAVEPDPPSSVATGPTLEDAVQAYCTLDCYGRNNNLPWVRNHARDAAKSLFDKDVDSVTGQLRGEE